MKTKKLSRALTNLKKFGILPVIAVGIITFSSCSQKKSPDQLVGLESSQPPKPPTMIGGDTTWVQVDQMPVFPGGDEALLNYLAENTTYPELAKKNSVQGRVIIRFCVTTKGTISEVSVLKGVSSEIDSEAIRVVKTLPHFEPARNNGKIVPVWYMVPITFALK